MRSDIFENDHERLMFFCDLIESDRPAIMSPSTSPEFVRLGFHVWSVPGVSRAWRYEFDDGRFVLVTDTGGYDLPEPTGPYVAICLSGRNEQLDFQPLLRDMKAVYRWFRRQSRGSTAAALTGPASRRRCPMS